MTFPTRVLFDSVINLRMTRDFGGVGFGVLGLEEGVNLRGAGAARADWVAKTEAIRVVTKAFMVYRRGLRVWLSIHKICRTAIPFLISVLMLQWAGRK